MVKLITERAQCLYEAYRWNPHRSTLLRQAEQLEGTLQMVSKLHHNSL